MTKTTQDAGQGARPKRPACPSWLPPEAKSEFRRVVQLLEDMGTLSHLDADILGIYAHSFALWKSASRFVDEHGPTHQDDRGHETLHPMTRVRDREATRLLALAKVLGLAGPDSRSRILVAEPVFDEITEYRRRRAASLPPADRVVAGSTC